MVPLSRGFGLRKTIINLVAHENIALGTELFCAAVGRRLLGLYSGVDSVTVSEREMKWQRLAVGGTPHAHSLMLDNNGKPFAKVVATRGDMTTESGVSGFTFMKLTGSGWENYLQDGFTTIPETHDRLAATAMDAFWPVARRASGLRGCQCEDPERTAWGLARWRRCQNCPKSPWPAPRSTICSGPGLPAKRLIADAPPAKRRRKIRGTDVQPPKTTTAVPQPSKAPAANAVTAKSLTTKSLTAKSLTEGQRAYEAKRAAKAGMSLEKWLASKEREREAEAKAKLKAVPATKPSKPPGFFGRLLERAQRPLGS